MRFPIDSLAWLRRAVVAGLTLAVMIQAAEISVHLWSLARESPAPARRGTAALTTRRDPRATVQDVLAAHLFGRVAEPDTAASPADAAQWVLSGTVEGSTPGMGAAIIGRSGAATRYCVAGENIVDGFTLAQVFADRVTVEHGGERLTVMFPRVLAGAPALAAAREAAEPVPARARRAAPNEPPTIRPPLNQPPAMLVLRPARHSDADGHYDGMRIQGAGYGRGLDGYGLQRNDVIREVDGRPINSPEAALKALETLSRIEPVSVTVERDGARFSVRLAAVNPGT